VETLGIVVLGVLAGGLDGAVDAFVLQGGEERLGHGVELVLLGRRQAGHPGGNRVGIVGDLFERRTGVGHDREQVVVSLPGAVGGEPGEVERAAN